MAGEVNRSHRFLLGHIAQTSFVQLLFSLKCHLFLIQSLERSELAHTEHDTVFRLVAALVEVSLLPLFYPQTCPSLIPPSLLRSLIAIASDPTDPLLTPALQCLLSLLIKSPRLFISCNGVPCLLNGCILTHNTPLLQSALLTCLFFLNDKPYRQSKLLLDMQVILDPLLADTPPTPTQAYDESLVFVAPNIAVLTVLRSWNGFADRRQRLQLLPQLHHRAVHAMRRRAANGHRHSLQPLHALRTARAQLAVRGRLGETVRFLDALLALSRPRGHEPLRTHFRAHQFAHHVLVGAGDDESAAKLPETLVVLLKNSNTHIVFLARCLLTVLSLFSNLFISPAQNTCYKSISTSLLLSLKETAKTPLTYSIISIDSSAMYLYPILQHSLYTQNDLVDYMSWVSLYHTIIDSFCDNQHAAEPFSITDTLCQHSLINQSMLSRTLSSLFRNRQHFTALLRDINVNAAAWRDG